MARAVSGNNMSKQNLNGRVVHVPGPWGVDRPCAFASVKIIDLDLNGKHDEIWSGKTDENGRFSGVSEEWKDKVPVWVPFPPPGHWSKVDDLTDILSLLAKVEQDGKSFNVPITVRDGGTINGPIVVPGPPKGWNQVEKSERALVVVTYLAGEGREDWQKLYEGLDTALPNFTLSILGPRYEHCTLLTRADGSRRNLLNALQQYAGRSEIEAIDVIVNVHGGSGTLTFSDGLVASEILGDEIQRLNISAKLRLCYSTACYGASHCPDMLRAGFDVAIGATAINASSASEYPLFLGQWALGRDVAASLSVADTPATRGPADDAARLSFSDVNSKKQLFGNGGVTISRSPSNHVSTTLVPGNRITLMCAGLDSGSKSYLEGHMESTTVGLSSSADSPAARWEVGDGGSGAVTFKCLGTGPEPHRYLDGHTGDASLGLSATAEPPFTGARWVAGDAGDGTIVLRCLGTGSETQRYLEGSNDGSVKLSEKSAGIRWEATVNDWSRFSLSPPHTASASASVTAIAREPDSMDVWWISLNGSIQGAQWRNGVVWQLYELAPAGSASLTSGIIALSRMTNTMEVWWVAPNGSVQDANWYEHRGWDRFELAPAGSASTTTGLAAVARAKSMEVWWVSPNGSVQDANWYEHRGWDRFELAPAGSASTTTGLAAVARIPTSMEVWWVAPNGSVQDANWYEHRGWDRFELAPAGSASTTTGLAAVARIPTSMEVWWVAPNGSVQDAYWYDGDDGASWGKFQLAEAGSASPNSGIAAVHRLMDHMELWWVAQDNSVRAALWRQQDSWRLYALTAANSSSPGSCLAAVSRIPGSMEVWWVGPDGAIQDSNWYAR
jgi:hypothetical protein